MDIIHLLNLKYYHGWPNSNKSKQDSLLQDFTVLPTKTFRRCVIRSSSVIFYRRHYRQNTSAGFTFVGDSPFRRYISRKNKKTIYWRVYRRNVRAKKKDSRLKYTDGFSFRWWRLNYWRKISVVKSVGEFMTYRRNIAVCKVIGTGGSYC